MPSLTDPVRIETTPLADDSQDQLLLSIRTIEAIREFAKEIVPLQADGSNLRAWVCEVDDILVDLLDCENYLQGGRPASLNKSHDRVARRVIYWTVPRELRPCLRDAPSAHDAYEALSAQFLRNNRTGHMAAIVELFNFQMDITQPKDVGKLYNDMYHRFHELVHSGFSITEDALLGALFQIAIGRSNFDIYTQVSRFLDVKAVNGSTKVTSQEVAAVARMRFDIMQKSMSAVDDHALGSPAASGATEPFQLRAIEPAPSYSLAGSVSSTAQPSYQCTEQSVRSPPLPYEQPQAAQTVNQPGSSLPSQPQSAACQPGSSLPSQPQSAACQPGSSLLNQPQTQPPPVSQPKPVQTPIASNFFAQPILLASAPKAPNPPLAPSDAPAEPVQAKPTTKTPFTPAASTSTAKLPPAKPFQLADMSPAPAKPFQLADMSPAPANLFAKIETPKAQPERQHNRK